MKNKMTEKFEKVKDFSAEKISSGVEKVRDSAATKKVTEKIEKVKEASAEKMSSGIEKVRESTASKIISAGIDASKEKAKELKIYSGIDNVPSGTAPDDIIDGCMVLEGGGFRGVYTAGVLDYLMQNGINMRSTVGVSAGAMTGVNYVSGQIGRSARVNLRYRHESDYIGIGAIKKNDGIVGFDFVYNEIDKTEPLDKERFNDPSRQFVAVATNCLTGKEEYFDKADCSDIYQAVRASASLPFVSKMVDIDGKPYLDGGCACKIPYKWALEQGFEKIIVVKTRDDSYRKPTPKPQVSTVCDMTYRNYPEFARSLANSDENYNRECDELEELRQQGRVFVVSPSQPVTVSRMESDMEKLGELYFLGIEDAKRNLEALKEYLAR